MEENVKKLNGFSRSAGNDARMGYFPTDQGECRKIANLLEFGDETCCLDLCAGEGDALITVTGKEQNSNVKLFAVELQHDRAEKLRRNPSIDYVVEADAIAGTRISHGVFSFGLANPPYGEDSERGGRLETVFLDRYADLLKASGLLVLVVPHYILTDKAFVKKLIWKFNPVYTAKFVDEVYKDYKQCVTFAYRKGKSREGWKPELVEAFIESVSSVEKLPYLPSEDVKKRISVLPSKDEHVTVFTTSEFDPEIVRGRIQKTPLNKVANDTLSIADYTGINVGKPPAPLNRNLMYTCAVAGVGQGLAGSVEGGDLHLQKGRVQQKESVHVVKQGDQEVEQVTVSAVTSMVILDAQGGIRELVGEASVNEDASEEDY